MEIVSVSDVYGDEVDVSVCKDGIMAKDTNARGLVMMEVEMDMMMTPKQARELAAALILAAEECEK